MTTPTLTPYQVWYDAFHSRIQGWIAECGARSAEVVLLLPDLLTLLSTLSADERIPAASRAEFEKLAAKIMRGIDYLPDGLNGTIGLVNDAITIAEGLQRALPHAPAPLLREVWRGEGDILARMEYLLNESDQFNPAC